MTPAATAASKRKTIYLISSASGSNVAGLPECIEVLGYRYLGADRLHSLSQNADKHGAYQETQPVASGRIVSCNEGALQLWV